MKSLLLFWFIVLPLGLLQLSSCRKAFLTNPSTHLVESDLEGYAEGAQVVLNGTYRLLRAFGGGGHYNFGIPAICLATDLMSADMAQARDHWFSSFYDYSTPASPTSGIATNYWRLLYRVIANVNIVLARSPQPRQEGQALALRAYAYTWLVNLYANYWKDSITPMLPLSLTDNQSADPAELASTKAIYDQIIKDLSKSIEAFRKTQEGRSQKSQIDSSVAHGLLARAYLYTQKYKEAKEQACLALGAGKNGNKFDCNDLMDSTTFKNGFNSIDNIEWMWGLPSNVQQSTIFASYVSMADPTIQGYAGGSRVYKCMSRDLYDSMHPSDVRRQVIAFDKKVYDEQKKKDVGSRTVADFKFGTKDITEGANYVQLKFRDPNSSWSVADEFIKSRKGNTVVGSFTSAFPLMRKAEMYLIAAEAHFNQSNTNSSCCSSNDASSAVCKLREKRGNKHTTSCNNNCCNKDSVILERRRELWGEGFALIDLKRLKKPVNRQKDSVHLALTAVNKSVLYVSANSDSLSLLIPRSEINTNKLYNGRQPR